MDIIKPMTPVRIVGDVTGYIVTATISTGGVYYRVGWWENRVWREECFQPDWLTPLKDVSPMTIGFLPK